MAGEPSEFVAAALRLRERREALGLSIAHVAERLGVNAPRYRHWEAVFGPLPQRQYGDALARILDVAREWLCAGQGEVEQIVPPDLESLGERAKARRLALGMSRSALTEAICISSHFLANWEERLPRVHKGAAEDRWEDALQVPRGWLRNPPLAAPEIGAFLTLDLTPAHPESVSDEIRAVGIWLTRSQARSRTIRPEDLTEAESRRAAMFADRYGVSGPEKTILQVIGDRFALTRERVRQVVEAMAGRTRGVTFVLPRLLQLREIAATAAATSVATFEDAHRALLGPQLSLGDANTFAREILGASVVAIAERSHWPAGNAVQPMLGGTSGLGFAMAVRDASRRMIRSCGAANVMFVTGMASAALGEAVSVEQVRRVLSAVDGMEWLTEDEEWYWFGITESSNRALDVARKALSVAGCRLDIEELQQAVCRSRRVVYEERRGPPAIEAPRHVLREVFARVPWLTVVQFDDFALAERLAPEDALNDSELAVSEAIRRNGGAVARRVLDREFVRTGRFSAPNLQLVLSHSPVIRPLGYGIYGLRGVPVSEPAWLAAEAAVRGGAPRKREADGWFAFSIAITDLRHKRSMIDFPASVVGAIPAGEYQVGGLVSGTLVVGAVPSNPCRINRLMPLLRHAGVRPGETLRVRIHPDLARAEISRETGGTTGTG